MSKVLCLAVGDTYELVNKTGVTAHPAQSPYPRKETEYVVPIKKGGSLEVIWNVVSIVECIPGEFDDLKISTEEMNKLTKYHELRVETYVYGKENTPYRYYIMDNKRIIKDDIVKKGIRVAVNIELDELGELG